MNFLHKDILLPNGGTLQVDITPQFLQVVAQHFQLDSSHVDDDHIRMYIWGAFKTAVDKAERGEGYVEERDS